MDPKNELAAMFKSKTYITLTVACFFVYWSMFVPFYFLPTYGQRHGLKEIESKDLLALLRAGSSWDVLRAAPPPISLESMFKPSFAT